MSTLEIKGYLFFESVKKFEKNRNIFEELAEPSADKGLISYAGNGWYKITHSIADGDFVKIAAQRDKITVETRFNVVNNVPEGDNGYYEIKGGSFAGNGAYLNISRKRREDLGFHAKDNADFTNFFICHSHSWPNGVHFLRWRIALKEFSN